MPVLTLPLTATVRLVRWTPLLIATGLGAAAVAARHEHDAAAPLQLTSIMLATAFGFAFDDGAAAILGPSPASLLHRRLHRVVAVIPPTAAVWTVLLAVQGPAGAEEALALVTLFAGMLGVAMAIAGVTARRTAGRHAGVAVGGGLLVALALSSMMPARWRPMPLGDIPGGWSAIYIRWTFTAIVGVAVFLWSSRDPAR